LAWLIFISPAQIKRAPRGGPSKVTKLYSDDVLCLGAFLAVGDSELDLLAFCQSFESVTLDRTEVCKYVGARFLGDKAEAFGFVEPLNGSACCRHVSFLVYQSNYSPSIRAGLAGSVAITYEKQDEVLQKRLQRNIETACIGKSVLTGKAEYRASLALVKEINSFACYT
jgi:hypothetical protein